MKYALVNSVRQEATPKSPGECPGCGAPVIAKCGTVKLWHWAHVSRVSCDHWWEPETLWHRAWKNEFPSLCQEIRRVAVGGEVHIADVVTDAGVVIEFQHSDISVNERASRESFYGRMVWLVDGTRRKRDGASLQSALREALIASREPLRFGLNVNDCALLARWAGSRCPIFVDCGDHEFALPYIGSRRVLWRLQYHPTSDAVLVTPLDPRSFVHHFRDGKPLRGCRIPSPPTPRRRAMSLTGFERYLQRREANRRRF
jgi:hypothetical protein